LDAEPAIVVWNVADEVKAGEFDEFVLNVGNSYDLVVPENHTPVAEEMEVSSGIFSVISFASNFVWAASFCEPRL